MANCGPCLKLGLQLIAHYPANRSAGKDAMCYYHHFGMPLPASIQAKIAQPKPVDALDDATLDKIERSQADRTERDQAKESGTDVDDARKEANPEKKIDPRIKGNGSLSRAGLTPDVCEECWADGHACPAHCTVGKQRLCIDYADGKPCAVAREKAANPRTPAHERYRVTIPGTPKPANAQPPDKLPIPPAAPKHRAGNISLVLDERGMVTGVKRTTPATPAAPAAPRPVVPPKPAPDPVRAAEKEEKRDKEKSMSPAPTPPTNSTSRVPPTNGTAMIRVTEENLNSFWMKLSLEEKAVLFQRQLEGA
jgi:hypothetical protein